MRWIEIMGPHGIGKTYLVKRIRKRPGMARFRIKNEVVAPFIEGLDFNRPTTWKRLAHWQPFLEEIESLYKRSTPNAQADVKRRRNVCRSLVRMSMVQAAPGDEVTPRDIIGSEGMRLSFVLKNPSEVRSYFRAMPVSVGVVMLEADLDVIRARNKHRAPAVPDFGAFAERGIEACKIAEEELAKRTPVLRLDATRLLEENIQAILEFIKRVG